MKKVLIADDEKSLCSSLKKSLELTGEFVVETVSESKIIVEAAVKFKPDVILLDVMMPGKSGNAVALELKEKELTKNIPLIFLTGIVSAEEVSRNDNIIGGEYFVAKPVDTVLLAGLIEKLT
jgi:CheY-like chemotaxis protein